MNFLFISLTGLLLAFVIFQQQDLVASALTQGLYLQIVGSILIGFFFIKNAIQKNKAVFFSTVCFFSVLWIIWALLCSAWAIYPMETLLTASHWYIFMLLMSCLLLSIQQTKQFLFFLLLGSLGAIGLLFRKVTADSFQSAYSTPMLEIFSQTLAGENIFFLTMIIAATPLLLLLFTNHSIVLKVVGFIAMAVASDLMLKNASLIPLCLFAGQIFLFAFVLLFSTKKLAYLHFRKTIAMGLPLLLLLTWSLSEKEQFQKKLELRSNVLSTSQEDDLIHQGGVKGNGLGYGNTLVYQIGLNTLDLNDSLTVMPYQVLPAKHNYRQLRYDLGFVGLFLLGLFLGVLGKTLMSILKESQKQEYLLAILSTIGFLSMLISQIYNNFLTQPAPTLLFFFYIAGIAWCEVSMPSHQNKPRRADWFFFRPVPPTLFWIAGFSAIVLVVIFSFDHQRFKRVGDEFKLATAQYEMANYETALYHSLKALKLEPDLHQAELLAGACYVELEEDQKAEQYLNRGLAYYPQSLSGLWKQAQIYLRKAKVELISKQAIIENVEEFQTKAEELLQKIERLEPKQTEVFYERGELLALQTAYLIYIRDEKSELVFKQAVENLERAIEYRSYDHKPIATLAQIYEFKKDHTKAAEYAQKIIEGLFTELLKMAKSYDGLPEEESAKQKSPHMQRFVKYYRYLRRDFLENYKEMTKILRNYYARVARDPVKYMEVLEVEEQAYTFKLEAARELAKFSQEALVDAQRRYAPNSAIYQQIAEEAEVNNFRLIAIKKKMQKDGVSLLIDKAAVYQILEENDKAETLLRKTLENVRKKIEEQKGQDAADMLILEKSILVSLVDVMCSQSLIAENEINLEKFEKLSATMENYLESGRMTEEENGYTKYKRIYERYQFLKKLALENKKD